MRALDLLLAEANIQAQVGCSLSAEQECFVQGFGSDLLHMTIAAKEPFALGAFDRVFSLFE